ncbi:hypothetical protein [Cyclobacterium marinum]|uniref:hypothetical protein n=1 Tax=Cyclobacterium marinum TaxID=104 RepID=UPI0011ECF9F0|nr:hypothetical protein [Cyclobacterium marinum]MBI0400394.1 hypothetical protein [Cyclobacterium marinum]
MSETYRLFLSGLIFNKVENFPHCRSKLHFVKLEPVVPEAEPVEAIGIEERLATARLILSGLIFNKVENFPHCRSKLHFVKLEPVVPEAEPVEAVGAKEGYFQTGVGYFKTYPLEFITSITHLRTGIEHLKLTSSGLLTRISRFRTHIFHLQPEKFDQKLTRNRVNIGISDKISGKVFG